MKLGNNKHIKRQGPVFEENFYYDQNLSKMFDLIFL